LRQIRAEASALVLQLRGFRTSSQKTLGKVQTLLHLAQLSAQTIDAVLQ